MTNKKEEFVFLIRISMCMNMRRMYWRVSAVAVHTWYLTFIYSRARKRRQTSTFLTGVPYLLDTAFFLYFYDGPVYNT